MSTTETPSPPTTAAGSGTRSSSGPAAGGGPARPPRLSPPWDRRRLQLLVFTIVLLVLSVLAIQRMELSPTRLVDGWENMWRLFWGIDRPHGIWPPSFDEPGEIWSKTVETIFMAILATFLAAVLSFPLGFLAARNTTPHPVLRYGARSIIAGARTIPDLIYAAILVRAFTIGPAAGVLAIAFHAIGMLAKLLADAIEEVDTGQREGIAATGAGWFQQMATGVVPQIVPTYLGVCFYRFDINFRSSTILGLVGAGGLGQLLNFYKGALRWDLFMGVVVAIIITVLIVEWLSVTGRMLILGHDQPGMRRRRARFGRTSEHLGRHVVQLDDFRPLDRPAAEPTPMAERSLTPPWTPERRKLAGFTGVVGVLVLASTWLSGVSWLNVANGFRPQFGEPGPGELPTVWFIAQRLVPRSLDWFDDNLRSALLDTLAMGLAATALGLPIALLLGYLGARNVAPNRPTYLVSRIVQVLIRAVPEVVIAILLVAAVGLGVFPGAVALTIGVVAVGAKFFSDALEIVDEGPRDGLRSTGASGIQQISSAVTPQFVPNLVANGLYLLDIMIRSSTIVGIFGAGGIGFIIFQATRLLQWETLGGLLICIFIVVFTIERFSDWARTRLI